MIDDFIKIFSGLKENFGIADMSKVEFDASKIKLSLNIHGLKNLSNLSIINNI